MLILSIETSCDETAIAIIKASGSFKKPHFRILANQVSSQIKIHQKYGGVVPTLAAREHVKNLPLVLRAALFEASKKLKINSKNLIKKIDAIAVTYGPGLIPALLIGVNFARTLSWLWQKPLIGVNHLEGHLYSNLIEIYPKHSNFLKKVRMSQDIKIRSYKFPALALIVSGGHTQLILMKNYWNYKLLGETRDDAVGEAFDKVARLLGLKYPGGPEISKIALRGRADAFNFPRPMIDSHNFDFSFSGLKTAVLYEIKNNKLEIKNKKIKANLAASFQQAAVDSLVAKTIMAAKKYKVKRVLLSGGVAANRLLRETLKNAVKKLNPKIQFSAAPGFLCTDNATMIGMAGYFHALKHKIKLDEWCRIKADANLRLRFN